MSIPQHWNIDRCCLEGMWCFGGHVVLCHPYIDSQWKVRFSRTKLYVALWLFGLYTYFDGLQVSFILEMSALLGQIDRLNMLRWQVFVLAL